jgi:hypothetical protein
MKWFGIVVKHELIVEYKNGRYEARCGCGCWSLQPVIARASRVREVYPRMEEEHHRHVHKVENPKAETVS